MQRLPTSGVSASMGCHKMSRDHLQETPLSHKRSSITPNMFAAPLNLEGAAANPLDLGDHEELENTTRPTRPLSRKTTRIGRVKSRVQPNRAARHRYNKSL